MLSSSSVSRYERVSQLIYFANTPQEVKPEERQPSIQELQVVSSHAHGQNSTLQYPIPGSPLFKEYKTVDEVQYSPEAALRHGNKMVQMFKSRIESMNLGSKLRQEVWARDITKYVHLWRHDVNLTMAYVYFSLESQRPPTTLIAICGGM